MLLRRNVFLLLTITILLLAVPAGAVVVQYTTRASWQAATSNVTVIDFNTLANSGGQATRTIQTVTFASFFNNNPVNEVFIDNSENWGTDRYLKGPGQQTNDLATLRVSFSSPVTAFGSDLMYSGSEALVVRLALSTGVNLTSPTTLPGHLGPLFFGFTSDTAVSSIVFRPTALGSTEPRIILDDVSFGNGFTETPETSTVFLGGSGLILLVLTRFPRRKVSTPKA